MKCSLRILLATLLIVWRSTSEVSAQSEADGKLTAFFQSYLQEHFRQQPLDATSLGDHHFDALLDDLSPSARAGWHELARRTLTELLQRVPYASLSRDGQIDFEIFRHNLETQLWLDDNTHEFAEDPRIYCNTINDSVYQLLTQSTLPKETNIANCLTRMAEFPRIVAAAKASLSRPPKAVLETAIRQNRGTIDFFQSDIFKLAGETPQLAALQKACTNAVTVLEDYQHFLEGPLLAQATDNWRLGKSKFNRKLELILDAGTTADQVLADARAEFVSVRSEMYVVARQLWSHYFPAQPVPPDDAGGRRETITKVINAVNAEHGKPEELVADAQAAVREIKAFISDRHYLRLPEPDLCQVLEMPEFRRGNSLAYLESAPPLDPAAASHYAISPPPADWTPRQIASFLEEYNHHMLKILTIHEGYPGHYVQLEYANRHPSLIRRVYQSGPFVEGWAVYGEITMLNEGFGKGDLRLRLMQQKFYLRAVANAILDNQFHCTAMTDAEAMKFLQEDAFQSEGEARLKLIRAKQSSTQLSTYFVGRMAHYRLHQQIARELGDRFDLGRYHEAVLSHGSVPVKYLPELVRRSLGSK